MFKNFFRKAGSSAQSATPDPDSGLRQSPVDEVATLVGAARAQLTLGQHQEALASFEQALTIAPESVAALCGSADALRALDRHELAVQRYSMALKLEPEHVDVLLNRGNLLHLVGRSAEAVLDYDDALLFGSDVAVIAYNRGIALHAIGRREEAAAAFSQALAANPVNAAALQNLAIILAELGRHEDALGCYEKLVAMDPSYPHAIGNVAYIKAQLAQWKDRDLLVRQIDDAVSSGQNPVVPLVYLSLTDDPAAQLRCAVGHAAARHPQRCLDVPMKQLHHDRIRVAYVSADFHDHAMPYLMAGVFEQHDQSRFEITALSLGPDVPSPMRDRLKAGFARFIDVRGLADVLVAKLIRDLAIDIVVDLMGYTGGARVDIFAYRPAPIQVNYLGFPATMGARYYDYIIADEFVIPKAFEKCYSENVVRLPDTFQANDSTRTIADYRPTRVDCGLPERGFVFCSFNSTFKVTPTMFDIWMRLLLDVEGSVLWLLGGNDSAIRNLRGEAQARRVAPERLIFATKLPYAEHLARYQQADLFLDTLPFNAGATASDALWAGLPVLTCAGNAFAARMAGSLLHALQLDEMVTYSLAEYEVKALQLATLPGPLRAVRERLHNGRAHAPPFDTDRFRKNLERAYLQMWSTHQRGERPGSFTVEPMEE